MNNMNTFLAADFATAALDANIADQTSRAIAHFAAVAAAEHDKECAALTMCFAERNATELDLIEAAEREAAAAAIEAAAIEAAAAAAAAAAAENTDFASQILKTLQIRNAEQHSKDTDTAINIVIKSAKQINIVFGKPEFNEIFPRLLKNMRIADKMQNQLDFVAVKVLVKIFNVISGIASGQLNGIDTHTKIIGFQLIKLVSLSNKSAMVAQCKSIKYDALDNVQALDYKHTSNYTIGTTGTQTSSTRMTLNYLGLCDVIKNKQNDNIIIQDNARCKSFINLFEKNKHEEKA